MKKAIAILLAAMMFALSACSMDTVFGAAPGNDIAAKAAAENYILQEKTAAVYWVNDRPDADEALQALAAAYTAETGVPVTIKTIPAESYENDLLCELDAMVAPTLITIPADMMQDLESYLYNLDGTAPETALMTDALNYSAGVGVTLGLPLSYECYGLAVDREALYELGYSAAGIRNYDALKAAANAVTASEAYTGAFASGQLQSFAELYGTLLLQDGSVQRTLKAVFDLYLANTAEGNGTAAEQLAAGTCVFAVLSSKDFDALPAPVRAEAEPAETEEAETGEETEPGAEAENGVELDHSAVVTGAEYRYGMLPALAGTDGDRKNAVLCNTNYYFGINKEADYQDILATVDFLNWLVTNGTAAQTLTDVYGVLPYFNTAEPANRFLADTNAMLADGRSLISPAGEDAQNWLSGLAPVLENYAAAKAARQEKPEEGEETEALPEPWEEVDAYLAQGLQNK